MTGATPPPITPASTPQRQPLAPSIRATWLGRLRAGDVDTINQLFIGLTIGHGVMFSWLQLVGAGVEPGRYLLKCHIGRIFIVGFGGQPPTTLKP